MKIHELFAYLCVENTAKAIEFYTEAFGAKEKFRLTEPSGRIGHAELDFGGTIMMLSDEFPECGIKGPKALGGTPVTIHIHVDDADEMIRRAVKAGAEIEREPQDAFYGERSGRYAILLGTGGILGTASKRFPPTRCNAGTRRCWRRSELCGSS